MMNKSTAYHEHNATTLLGKVYFSSLGLIFLSAFVSYYVQFPGLVSLHGIEPAWRSFSNKFPFFEKWLSNHLRRNDNSAKVDGVISLEIDMICETIALLGILLSSIAARLVFIEMLLLVKIASFHLIILIANFFCRK